MVIPTCYSSSCESWDDPPSRICSDSHSHRSPPFRSRSDIPRGYRSGETEWWMVVLPCHSPKTWILISMVIPCYSTIIYFLFHSLVNGGLCEFLVNMSCRAKHSLGRWFLARRGRRNGWRMGCRWVGIADVPPEILKPSTKHHALDPMESIDPYSPIHSPGWTNLARHALRNRATCATVRISHRSTPCTTLGWNKRRWDPQKKDEHGIEEIHGHFTLQFPGRLCWWLYNVIECYTMLYIIAILGIWYFYIISSQDSLRE